ncbi:oxidative stress transcriptional regulator AosR [Rhodococcus gordoniae]
MRQWTRKNSLSGPKLRSEMDAHEASVLRSLVSSVLGMLEERAGQAPQDDLAALTGLRTGNAVPPEIPALRRLLPNFHRPDSDSAANVGDDAADLNGAMRSLHEPSIIDAKLAAGAVILRTVPESGGKVVLNPEQAEAWLYGLNDVRLALGTTLGIDADTPDVLDDDDPRAPHLDVYHWLTWMQDSLVQALQP